MQVFFNNVLLKEKRKLKVRAKSVNEVEVVTKTRCCVRTSVFIRCFSTQQGQNGGKCLV